jgi:hypothetical protein
MSTKAKIAVICGYKKTDVLIASEISKHFSAVKIIQYQVPYKNWFSWITFSIKRSSFSVFVGHIFLSIYIRSLRFWQKIFGQSIWLKYFSKVPNWEECKAERTHCFSEKSLTAEIKGFDYVLLTDSFRLSHRFFRKVKSKIFEIVWGSWPTYTGDSGGFWAFLNNDSDNVKVSIIKRDQQFKAAQLVADFKVQLTKKETIRSVKVKQVKTLFPHLKKLDSLFKVKPKKRTKPLRLFIAPTFFTYWQFLKGKVDKIPDYAYKTISK